MRRSRLSVGVGVLALFAGLLFALQPAAADPPPFPTNCFPKLVTCGYPTRNTTGPDHAATLTPYTGVMYANTPNAVIEDLDITGCIVVRAAGIVIRDVKIHGDCYYGINVESGGATVSRVEISCEDGIDTGAGFSDLTMDHIYVHDCENALAVTDNVSVEDSVLEAREGTTAAHGDIIQGFHSDNVVIHHNLFNGYNDLTSSIITDPDHTTNWTVTDNFLMAGAYTIYCPHGTTSGFVVQNNRFYPKAEDATDRRSPAYGLTERCDTTGVTFTGNRTDDTGATVNADGTLS